MGKFIIEGSFHFDLKADNGEKILTSEEYTTKDSCKNGIASVKNNAVLDGQYEDRVAKDGQYYFVLKASNGEIIGTSEMYTSTGGRDKGKASVKANAPTAETVDQTK